MFSGSLDHTLRGELDMFKLWNISNRRAEDKNKTLVCTSTYIYMNGCAPTLSELRSMTGVRSESAILRYIRELIHDGFFQKEKKFFGLSFPLEEIICGNGKATGKRSA